MYDSISPDQIPADADFAAGYVDGDWPDFDAIKARLPNARILSVAVFPSDDAECLDIETGDAVPEDAPGWYERQRANGVVRPCLYADADTMAEVVPIILSAGIERSAVRLWSAHYTHTAHICASDTCGATSIPMDGTQWTDEAGPGGADLDESLLRGDFFDDQPAPPVQPPSVPAWQEAMMQALPEVKQGDTGEHVRTVQGLCIARGHKVTVDGVFGAKTHAAVVAIQAAAKIAQDGVAGPDTWPALAGV